MRSEPEVPAALRDWVRGKADGLEVTDATPLFEQRILRSVHVPELLLLLERLRGAPIDVERLQPGDLSSIDVMMDRFAGNGANRLAELRRIGLRWDDGCGQVGLSGPLLALADACDLAFRRLAGRWGAVEERHPAALPARLLADHLRCFPHQATFPVSLAAADGNLGAFVDGPAVDGDGAVALTRTAPVTDVLTPAACYHLYAAHQGEELAAPLYLTTRNTCFRREPGYQPLRRQWSFAMREIVCLGTPAETAAFLAAARATVDRFTARIDLPLDWLPATDPFFRPRTSPGHLLQRVQPTKHEATYGGGLATGSVNDHRDHFGAGFGITRDGRPASSACLAFGIERWLYALTDRHGTDPAGWPDLPAAAERAVTG